jgi:hypothetical protein
VSIWLALIGYKLVPAPGWLTLAAWPTAQAQTLMAAWAALGVVSYPLFIWVGWLRAVRGSVRSADNTPAGRRARARGPRLAIAGSALGYALIVYLLLVGAIHVRSDPDNSTPAGPARMPIHSRSHTGP